jgi:hypothetical protein
MPPQCLYKILWPLCLALIVIFLILLSPLTVAAGPAFSRSGAEIRAMPPDSPTAQLGCFITATVANANDSGAGSLRQAISDICDGGVIGFDGDYTIYLDPTLNITRSLTINDSGRSITIRGDSGHDGSRNVRPFTFLSASSTATLTNLSIVRGTIGTGFGVVAEADETNNLSDKVISTAGAEGLREGQTEESIPAGAPRRIP